MGVHLPWGQTGAYPLEIAAYVGHHLVHLLCAGQLERQHATLMFHNQLQGAPQTHQQQLESEWAQGSRQGTLPALGTGPRFLSD